MLAHLAGWGRGDGTAVRGGVWVVGGTEPERGPEDRGPDDPSGSALGLQAQAAHAWLTGSGVPKGLSQPLPGSFPWMQEEDGLGEGRAVTGVLSQAG